MLKQLKSLFTTKQTKQEASFFSNIEVTAIPLSVDNYLNSLTHYLPLASSCISLRARKVRSTPWQVVDQKGNIVENHGIKELIQPNSFQKFEDLLELSVWHLDALGNAYLYRLGGGLFLLPPALVTTYTIQDLFITRYELVTNEKIIPIEPNEMIHLKYPNPYVPITGMGLVQQAELLLQRNLNRDSYLSSFYKNGTVASGIFSCEAAAMNDNQRKMMRASFLEEMGGVKNFFKTFFAWGGYKFQQISTNLRDAQDVEQSKMTRDDILAVFGVPGALLGFTDGVNFSNAEIQERVFVNNTLIPLLQRLEQIITWELVQPINKNYRFEFLKPVNEDLVKKSAWVDKAFTNDIITKDEYRKLMGIK